MLQQHNGNSYVPVRVDGNVHVGTELTHSSGLRKSARGREAHPYGNQICLEELVWTGTRTPLPRRLWLAAPGEITQKPLKFRRHFARPRALCSAQLVPQYSSSRSRQICC